MSRRTVNADGTITIFDDKGKYAGKVSAKGVQPPQTQPLMKALPAKDISGNNSITEVFERFQQVSETPKVDLGDIEFLEPLTKRFSDSEFELSIVGGSVRDALLGKACHDYDLTTDARPEEIIAMIDNAKSSQTEKVGAIWDAGISFGTVGVTIGGEQVEVTTYRREIYDENSRKPQVGYGNVLSEDLERRDFTINAMAVRLKDNVLIDPFGGQQDLAKGILKTPGDPVRIFSEDPLRMMRAARFVSQLGFTVDENTFISMQKVAERISIVSAERISGEVVKMLQGSHPGEGAKVLWSSGVGTHVFGLGVSTQKFNTLNNIAKTNVSDDHKNVVRLSALMHDIVPSQTQHDEAKKQVHKIMSKLRFTNEETQTVSKVVGFCRKYGSIVDNVDMWTDEQVRRYVHDAGKHLEHVNHLMAASHSKGANIGERIERLADKEDLSNMKPALSSEQIMVALDTKPGKIIGQANSFLLDLRLRKGVVDKENAIKELLEWKNSLNI